MRYANNRLVFFALPISILLFLIPLTSCWAGPFDLSHLFGGPRTSESSKDSQQDSSTKNYISPPPDLQTAKEQAHTAIDWFKKTHNNHGGYLYQSKHIYNKILSSPNGLTDQEFEKELSHLGQEQKKHGVLPETHLKVASSLREYHETHKLARQGYKP